MSQMTSGTAMAVLAKKFSVTTDTFDRLSPAQLREWAMEVRQPGYVLRRWQYDWLIGAGMPRLHRNRLIERLNIASLMAVSQVSGRTIEQLASAAGVRG